MFDVNCVWSHLLVNVPMLSRIWKRSVIQSVRRLPNYVLHLQCSFQTVIIYILV